MPIKDKSKYPANWAEISKAQRERAGNKCELCWAANHQPHPLTKSKVVLTVHHIEWLPNTALNNSYPNLIALCQRCHNRLDLGKRQRNAAATRKERAAGRYCKNCAHYFQTTSNKNMGSCSYQHCFVRAYDQICEFFSGWEEGA